MKAGLVYDQIYLEHDTGEHLENSRRLTAMMSHLDSTGTIQKLNMLPPRPASQDELELIHTPEYISYVRSKAESGGGWLDPDTVVSYRSYNAASCAAGGLMVGVNAVMRGDVDSAFALVRPPGHHAVADRGMGFCLFNNVAIAAKFALESFSLSRVLIVDFDVHHGNGTQDAFYADPKVLYFSTHEYPFYPGTGRMQETGTGDGEGTTVNIPMAAGWGDEELLRAFDEVLIPVARRFQPELILVSAGFDAHWADHLAMMRATIRGFARMTIILKKLADELCQGRLVFTLEGGYNLRVGAFSVKAMFDVLTGDTEIQDPLGEPSTARKPEGFDDHIKQIKRLHLLE
ncbi:MAG: histone deacetylase [Dehalococcoidia bacterium]